jgi:hypothetical protein
LLPDGEAADPTLADGSARCGIDQLARSRLENGHTPNPTLDTLWRCAGQTIGADGGRGAVYADASGEWWVRGGEEGGGQEEEDSVSNWRGWK